MPVNFSLGGQIIPDHMASRFCASSGCGHSEQEKVSKQGIICKLVVLGGNAKAKR